MDSGTGLTFIDLFAGIGGIRMAFDQAGFRCVYSNEVNPSAAATYERNFGDIHVADIRYVDEKDIPPHDVLCGGFPCQPFSKAGISARVSLKRGHGFEDENHGTLFFEIIRILKYHKPRAVFLENVANLRRHNGGDTYSIIKEELEKAGYNVSEEVLDASLVVPHRRKRIYIVGIRKPDRFQFPKIRQKKYSLADVLERNPSPIYTISDLLWKSHKARTERNRKKGNGFAHYLLDKKGIANTLTARYYKDGRENLISQKNKNPRMLTPRECARLMGFPDSFELPDKKTPAYRQMGNSVCMPLVRIIARALAAELMMHKKVRSMQRKRARPVQKKELLSVH